MLRVAHTPYAAFLLLLGLLWAVVVPVAGQDIRNLAYDRLSPAEQQAFRADAQRLSDVIVESVRSDRRFHAEEIGTEEWRQGKLRLNARQEAILAPWQARDLAPAVTMVASDFARERIAALDAQYGYAPREPTLRDWLTPAGLRALAEYTAPFLAATLMAWLPVLFIGALLILYAEVQLYALIGHWFTAAPPRRRRAWPVRLAVAALQLAALLVAVLAAMWLASGLAFDAFIATYLAGPLAFFGPLFTAAVLLIALKFAAWVWRGLRYRRPRAGDAAPPLSGNYGSARYADLRTGMPHDFYGFLGVFFGKSSAPELAAVPLNEQPGAPVVSTPEHHTLIVARTRTGKGTRIIVPTLLRYMGSAIVIDPKGENAAITARIRRDLLGQDVHVINPWGELASAFAARGVSPTTFNPLDVLDRNDPNAVAVAQALAGAVCPSSPGDKDRYWQGSAANVLTAVLLWITDQPGEQKTLARAREIVSLSRKDFTDAFLAPMAASSAFGGAIREMVSPYLDLAQETYSGIMANLSENTKFLSDPQIKAATARSSFDIQGLIRAPGTIYLVIPPDRIDTQRTWLRLMTAAAMHTFKRYPLEGRPPHRCMVLMDEFPALGRIEDMPRDIATMSGYGIDFTLIVQGLDQLKDLYGAAAGTLLSNCAYKWFCNVNDLESARYLSDTLGKQTVRTVGRGESENQGPGGAGKGESVNYGETGRPLLMPDEVLSLGRDVAILINPEGRPHYLRPVDYWRLPNAFATLAERYPKLYWNPPLSFDDNPYVVPRKAAPRPA